MSTIRCMLCPNYCVIPNYGRGRCKIRLNKNGELYTLTYGKPCAVHVDPIEKKPLFHMLPGSSAFSIATAGCCLSCKYCQNWEISQAYPEETRNYDLPPEALAPTALKYGCSSIAYTYTEPTIFFEYMLDTAKLARQYGVKNVTVTCGFINPEPLRELAPYLDGTNIDLKGFNDDFYQKITGGKLEPVKECIKYSFNNGIITEVTNLVVPTINDDLGEIREMCSWLKDDVGPDVPLHFSRFHPQYKLKHLPPTPYSTLSKARKIALDVGLKYVYIGNVYEREGQNTYCPKCGKIIVGRAGYAILNYDITDGKCKFCDEKIYGMWS